MAKRALYLSASRNSISRSRRNIKPSYSTSGQYAVREMRRVAKLVAKGRARWTAYGFIHAKTDKPAIEQIVM
jgi:uncharacterized protein YdiU (UPF0061 family)